jgi:hypothetical protein
MISMKLSLTSKTPLACPISLARVVLVIEPLEDTYSNGRGHG